MNRLLRYLLISLVAVSLAIGTFAVAKAADPAGTATYSETPAGNKIAINFSWTLIAGMLVFIMQLGFAFLGGGALRTKNQVNYWTKSYMDFSVGAIAYMFVGFGLMFGGSGFFPGLSEGNSIIGWSGFGLLGEAYDVSTIMYFFFQAMFAATAATIVAGMLAERLKFQAYLIYSIFITAVIYSIYGHWIWGNGWLATLPFGVGARDFAGSGAVHMIGGFVGLAGAWLLGPRIGKYNKNGTPNVIPGHNVPFVVIGTFILFFGWFGFNPGSTLAATDLRIAVVATNTFLAGAAGATIIAYLTYFKRGKADTVLICNGTLGGLVGITAPAAYVAPWASIVIGAVGGLVVWGGNWFVEWKLRIDDAVGACGVHGFAGIWGLLAVGIFADGTYGGVKGLIIGETGQMVAQMVDAAVALVWAFGMGLLIFGILKKTIGIRVSREEELEGLDLGEHGQPAYPETPVLELSQGRGD